MLVVGLTGSIAMGKSTAAARFRERGVAVFDADAEVHKLYDGPLASAIEQAFPGTTARGRVDRQKLYAALVEARDGFRRLEGIVHPAVRAAERAFLHEQRAAGADMAVLEIPLLFESGADALVDAVVVVSAESDVQRRRVLDRPGMTEQKFKALTARQKPDAEKRSAADFVVDTSGSIDACCSQIDYIIGELKTREGLAYDAHWR